MRGLVHFSLVVVSLLRNTVLDLMLVHLKFLIRAIDNVDNIIHSKVSVDDWTNILIVVEFLSRVLLEEQVPLDHVLVVFFDALVVHISQLLESLVKVDQHIGFGGSGSQLFLDSLNLIADLK